MNGEASKTVHCFISAGRNAGAQLEPCRGQMSEAKARLVQVFIIRVSELSGAQESNSDI